MEWIFVVPGVGVFAVLAAQLLEYVVESARRAQARMHVVLQRKDRPPVDVPPANQSPVPYDRAA